MSAPIRLATTLLLLRDTDEGVEVFMVQRHRRSGFLPNAWVFPGGRVDPADRLIDHPGVRGGDRLLAQLDLPRHDGLPLLIAGVRETFEEAGIWLGEGEPPQDLRLPLARQELSLPHLLATHDATVHLDALHHWSWWVTPEAEPRRYDTRFFTARVEGAQGRHCEHETVNSGWFNPKTLLSRTLSQFPLAPPTWWTLRELAAHPTTEAAIQATAHRPNLPIQPIMRFSDAGIDLLLPGHAEHPAPAIPGLPHQILFDSDRWIALQGDERLPPLP